MASNNIFYCNGTQRYYYTNEGHCCAYCYNQQQPAPSDATMNHTNAGLTPSFGQFITDAQPYPPQDAAAYPIPVQIQVPVGGVYPSNAFPCNTCYVNFNSPGDLARHMREVHQDERKWPCPRCDSRFKRNEHLQAHRKAYNH